MNVKMNWKSMWAIILKEIMDSVRNKWIIAITLVFVSLALLVSYFGSTAEALPEDEIGFRGFDLTILLMLSIVEFLVPIIALMLGYGAIVSEKEKGSLDLLMSMPISRVQVYLSKFLGLSMVLFISIFVGFGLAGIVIAASAGSAEWITYVGFMAASVMIGLVFLTLAMLLSTVLKRRSTAMGGAVLIWFLFIFIYTILVFGIGALIGLFEPDAGPVPGWFYAFQMFSPVASFEIMTIALLVPLGEPWFYNGATAWIVVVAWVLIPLVISIRIFTRKDILR